MDSICALRAAGLPPTSDPYVSVSAAHSDANEVRQSRPVDQNDAPSSIANRTPPIGAENAAVTPALVPQAMHAGRRRRDLGLVTLE